MGQALYRKYRSKKLDEVIGQEHITSTLNNALKTGKISHAYLFTGPKGVGKTSVARILAHEVNNFPYESDKYNVDIIEIDAASNRRIDEIRDLRDKVHVAPAFGKYKVYIIDEVHMLTKEAFNALLKTLEEPPEHVIFILATTEAHKLPSTIVSRTQRFSFKPIETPKVVEHLKTIAKSEGLKIPDEAVELIAVHGEGSFRDSISLLDQAAATGNAISVNSIQRLLGIAPDEAIETLLKALDSGSPKQIIEDLGLMLEQGIAATSIATQLAEKLRRQFIDGDLRLSHQVTAGLLKKLIAIPASANPERLLEIELLTVVLNKAQTGQIKQPSTPIPNASVPADSKLEKTKNNKATTQIEDVKSPKTNFSLDIWQKVLDTVKKQHNTLYSIMRMGEPSFDGEVLTLSFEFAFHQKRLNENKNRQIIDNIVNQYSSQPIKLVAVVAPRIKSTTTAKPVAGNDIKTISNIFGGAEVLDS